MPTCANSDSVWLFPCITAQRLSAVHGFNARLVQRDAGCVAMRSTRSKVLKVAVAAGVSQRVTIAPHPSGCGYPLGGRRPVTAPSSV